MLKFFKLMKSRIYTVPLFSLVTYFAWDFFEKMTNKTINEFFSVMLLTLEGLLANPLSKFLLVAFAILLAIYGVETIEKIEKKRSQKMETTINSLQTIIDKFREFLNLDTTKKGYIKCLEEGDVLINDFLREMIARSEGKKPYCDSDYYTLASKVDAFPEKVKNYLQKLPYNFEHVNNFLSSIDIINNDGITNNISESAEKIKAGEFRKKYQEAEILFKNVRLKLEADMHDLDIKLKETVNGISNLNL